MHPILFNAGPITIYSYGVLLASAYLLGLLLAVKRARAVGVGGNRIMDLLIWGIIAALVGAKALLFIVDFRHFTSSWQEFMTLLRFRRRVLWRPDAAIVVCIWQLRKHRCRVAVGRSIAPGIALGYHGRPPWMSDGRLLLRQADDVAWAVTFTDPAANFNVGTPLNVALHPTQLYEAGAGLVILIALLILESAPAISPAGRSEASRSSTPCCVHHRVSIAATIAAGSSTRCRRQFILGRARANQHLHAVVLDRPARPTGPSIRGPRKSLASHEDGNRGAGNRERKDRQPAHGSRPRLPTTRQEFVADAEAIGERLDRFLTAQIPDFSRSADSTADRERPRHATPPQQVKANHDLREGDVIGVGCPTCSPRAQPQDLPLDILFNDADLVVVNKPAGMVVHPAAGSPSGTLVNALLHHVKDLSGIGGEARPGIVHRLDKGTSGVMVIAKNDDAHRELARQFHDREVEKEYVALAWGLVQQRKRTTTRRTRSEERVKCRLGGRARSAVTRGWSRDLKGVTLLRVAIANGTHATDPSASSASGQPMSAMRCMARSPPRASSGCARCRAAADVLNAERLEFTHPRTRERLEFPAPLPADLNQ